MKKLNAVFSNDNDMHFYAKQAEKKLLVNQLWQSVIPTELMTLSSASHLKDGVLFILAYNAVAASKINLMQSSLLNALEISHKSHEKFKSCKVTAIKVKVQVKSTPYSKPKRVPTLNTTNANHLLTLSKSMQGSPLADVLNRIASKAKN